MLDIDENIIKPVLFDALNDMERNLVLYYADYLSLEQYSKPVTDTCKYFFIHGLPVNISYLADNEPVFDPNNKMIQRAYAEYTLLRDKFGEEGVETYIGDLSMLKARGCVNAEQMLGMIHMYSTKAERKFAFKEYYRWEKEQKYFNTITDPDGRPKQQQCTKYFFHSETMCNKRNLPKNTGNDGSSTEEDLK